MKVLLIALCCFLTVPTLVSGAIGQGGSQKPINISTSPQLADSPMEKISWWKAHFRKEPKRKPSKWTMLRQTGYLLREIKKRRSEGICFSCKPKHLIQELWQDSMRKYKNNACMALLLVIILPIIIIIDVMMTIVYLIYWLAYVSLLSLLIFLLGLLLMTLIGIGLTVGSLLLLILISILLGFAVHWAYCKWICED